MDWIDLLKALPLAAVGTFVVQEFRVYRRKGRMREQLYREISSNYRNTIVRIATVTSLPGLRQGAALHFTDKLNLSFNVWEFYREPKRSKLLFKLKEAGAINNIYEKFAAIENEAQSERAYYRAKEAAAEVDDRLLDRTLDKNLYQKASTPEAWKTMDELLAGRRKSYRQHLTPF